MVIYEYIRITIHVLHQLYVHVYQTQFCIVKLLNCLGFGWTIDYTSNVDGCGGKLVDYSGNFYSTGYPDAYKNNLDCEWQLVSPSIDQTITLSIRDLNVFYDMSTTKDKDPLTCFEDERIEIYQGSESSPRDTLLTMLCGASNSEPPIPVVAKYGKHCYVTVVFRSGSHSRTPQSPNGQWNGFWFHWET